MSGYRLARPVRPNAGLKAAYQRKLEGMLCDMTSTALAPVLGLYAPEPTLAKDASGLCPERPGGICGGSIPSFAFDASAEDMIAALKERFAEWAMEHGDTAADMATWFGEQSLATVSSAFKHSLASALGHTVKLQLTPRIVEALQSVVAENVGLIKSIHSVYAEQIQELVLESVHAGRDLAGLKKALEERYGVASSRAEFIAIDQNNKATGFIEQQRRLDFGIDESMWFHSGGGKVPRPSHVAAHRTIYKTAEGCLIDGEYIRPGEKPRCGCVSAAVIPAFRSWQPATDVSAYA